MAINQANGGLVNGGLVVKPVAFRQDGAKIGATKPEIYHRRQSPGRAFPTPLWPVRPSASLSAALVRPGR